MNGMKVEVMRGGRVESVHTVHVAVVGPGGEDRLRLGNVDEPVFTRSAIKPFQALPLIEDGLLERWDFGLEEVALSCASHSGEPAHVELAAAMLERLGLGPDDLACGAHPPIHGPSAAALESAGREPERLHNNCSGKHAGMLALARGNDWPVDGYHLTGHPVQERVAEVLAHWTGADPTGAPRGVDGCGVVTFALPLRSLAAGFSRLASAEAGTPGATVLEAMAANPHLMAGTGRLCTALAEATRGRVIAKVGAEGVYAAAVRSEGLGLALKVEDGSRRAAEVAVLAVLEAVGELRPGETEALDQWAEPAVLNTRGERVGSIRAVLPGRSGHDGAAHGVASLTPGLRALVRLSAALGGPERRWAQVMDTAAAAAPAEAEEVLLQSYLFLGYPVALNALGSWRRRTGRRGPEPSEVDPEGWQERGEVVCREVYGHQYEALREVMGGIHADLDRWAVMEGYGKVLGRPALDLPTRELCIAALLSGIEAPRQLHAHLRGCLNVGVAPDRVEAMLSAIAGVVGRERASAAREVWEKVRARRETRAHEGTE